jgi:hypothetical protein
MGYYSTFKGSFSTFKKMNAEQAMQIVALFKRRFGEYDEETSVEYLSSRKSENYEGEIFFSPMTNEIRPISFHMTGYKIKDHIARIFEDIRHCESLKVRFNGQIEVAGEDPNDLWSMTAIDYHLYICSGRVAYDMPNEEYK